MERNVKLSEMINELQEKLEKNGDVEIKSIGQTSGVDSSFVFRTNTNEALIRVKLRREK